LNEDKPFDQFIREHIAGDVFAKDDPQTLIGTAFLVAGPYDDVGNQDAAQAAQIRADTMDEIIRATGEAFLGLTLGCARCHDHKFDPIKQEDYYGLYATFSGIRHGSALWATPEQISQHEARTKPLSARKAELEKNLKKLDADLLERARDQLTTYETSWSRPPVDRTRTEDHFPAIAARFVRLVCEAQDNNPKSSTGFGIDEFEVWTASKVDPSKDIIDGVSINVALATNGARASGAARKIEDFPDAYGPQLTIDGKTGARFLATGSELTIELASTRLIDLVVFSIARGEPTPEHNKFTFVAEYRIEVSLDGHQWQTVASSADRRPLSGEQFLNHRLLKLAATDEYHTQRTQIAKELSSVSQELNTIPPLPTAWIGKRVAEDAKGPFNVFLGGSAQKRGLEVFPASLSLFDTIPIAKEIDQLPAGSANSNQVDIDSESSTNNSSFGYRLPTSTSESERRLALANWLVHPSNPLTPRVLVNRIWAYHFGTGIVDTPSDFGFMGGRPTHPELLDFLALQLREHNWQLKPLHRMIMLSSSYQQSAEFRAEAGKLDADSRLLWRFPPRRLAAEEIRDSMLCVAGQLPSAETPPLDNQAVPNGGPGFRLYQFMQDNVCTYVPLDKHGPETYRRAVYHQNARASVVDLMSDFDQPDCTFTAPKRASTTTPLQALTLLNHSFTTDIAEHLHNRVVHDVGANSKDQIRRSFQLCFSRNPNESEMSQCENLIDEFGLQALCRVLLNTSEFIYVQ
ncbi:MAG: DUF1553 domain-containing protein, partial [Planctomycetales bacterium]|nr:DUF1553 domain-containing protein [Planctomycetales bacterium]